MEPKIVYKQKWIKILPKENNEALIIWPYIFIQKPKLPGSHKEYWTQKGIIEHELVHWQQIKRNFIVFFYIKNFFYNIFYGYEKNPFEVEARKQQLRARRN